MLINTYLLAALAAVSTAAPTPSPEESAISLLETRDTANGAVIFYPQANYGGASQALPVFVYSGQQAFCQQFQPIVKGGLSFKSYVSSNILVSLYKSTDCSGSGFIIDKANGNASNNNTNASGYFSFQTAYLSS